MSDQSPQPHEKITGEERDALAAECLRLYESGMSIRRIADIKGRSYGNVHGMLGELGVIMRPRGGDNRHKMSDAAKLAYLERMRATPPGRKRR